MGQDRGEGGADDDRQEGAGFDQAVGPGELVLGDQLRDHPVLGGSEKGAVRRHQEDDQVEGVLHADGESRHRQSGDRHLHDFHRDDQAGLGETVGQSPGRSRKEQEGEDEGRADGGGDGPRAAAAMVADQVEDDQQLQDVVVECSEKLRGVEPKKGVLPAGSFHFCVLREASRQRLKKRSSTITFIFCLP